MSKDLNIGSIKISIPDYNSDVGKAIEILQNHHESGDLRALFVAFATKDSIASAIVGDAMVIPFVCMAADVIANDALDGMQDSLSSKHSKNDDD
jgi:hypothetical protein